MSNKINTFAGDNPKTRVYTTSQQVYNIYELDGDAQERVLNEQYRFYAEHTDGLTEDLQYALINELEERGFDHDAVEEWHVAPGAHNPLNVTMSCWGDDAERFKTERELEQFLWDQHQMFTDETNILTQIDPDNLYNAKGAFVCSETVATEKGRLTIKE